MCREIRGNCVYQCVSIFARVILIILVRWETYREQCMLKYYEEYGEKYRVKCVEECREKCVHQFVCVFARLKDIILES